MAAAVRAVTPQQLDTVKRNAVGLEERYMLQWMDVRLKRKYRPPSGAYPQWGSGGDHSGKAQQKGNNTAARARGVEAKPRHRRVDGLTGKSKMEIL